MKRPTDPELIDLALGRLAPSRREEVEAWLKDDVALAVRAREIRDHLRRYDALPVTPDAPSFDRVARDLTARAPVPVASPVPARRSLVGLGLGLAAAAVFVVLLLRGVTVEPPRIVKSLGEAGLGLEIERAGRRVSGSRIEKGDVVVARLTNRVVLDGGVDVVLAAGTRLAIVSARVTDLAEGRAYFEVVRGRAFTVRARGQEIRVLGTAFEVDVEGSLLDVRVARGSVRVGTRTLTAGEGLRGGERYDLHEAPGAFFRRPVLDVRGPERTASGAPVTLAFTLRNPGRVAMEYPGPEGVRVALWLEVLDPAGGKVDVPLEIARSDLVPGRSIRLGPLGTVSFEAQVAGPFRDRGVYRCRAMYRPEEDPPLISDTFTIEVR